jgi:hypothetical protein
MNFLRIAYLRHLFIFFTDEFYRHPVPPGLLRCFPISLYSCWTSPVGMRYNIPYLRHLFMFSPVYSTDISSLRDFWGPWLCRCFYRLLFCLLRSRPVRAVISVEKDVQLFDESRRDEMFCFIFLPIGPKIPTIYLLTITIHYNSFKPILFVHVLNNEV